LERPYLSWVTEDYTQAAAFLNDAIRLAQRDESPGADDDAINSMGRLSRVAASAMHHLGRRMCMEGDYQGAAHMLAASAQAYGELENSYALAYSLGWLGMVALAQGDYVQARARFEASSALSRQSGHTVGTAEFLIGLSTAAVYQGDYEPATAALKEATTTYYHVGNLYRVAQCLAIAAHMAQECGQPARAARLLGAAAAIWHDFPVEFLWLVRDLYNEYERCLPRVRAALDPASFETAWAEGLEMTIPQAIEVALAGERIPLPQPLPSKGRGAGFAALLS
jgi:tetratricopeptide (TPR) repeat protein